MSFLMPLCMVLMAPPFFYWFYLQITGKTAYKCGMAFSNMLFFYAVLSLGKFILPDSAFRLGFINGLMNESMFVWFAVLLCAAKKGKSGQI